MTDRTDAAGYLLDLDDLPARLADECRRLAARETPRAETYGAQWTAIVVLILVLLFALVRKAYLPAVVLGIVVTGWAAELAALQARSRQAREIAAAEPAGVRRVLARVTKGAGGATEAYGELVLALAEGGNVDAEIAETVLREANALLNDSDALAEQARIIEQASDGHSVEWRRAEARDLEKRLAAATDPMTRDALAHSVELARETLRSTEALHVMRGRIEAQQEAILHAFTGLRATLGRLRLATTALQAPDLSQIREMTARVHGQTRAVEEAVEEVVSLRAG